MAYGRMRPYAIAQQGDAAFVYAQARPLVGAAQIEAGLFDVQLAVAGVDTQRADARARCGVHQHLAAKQVDAARLGGQVQAHGTVAVQGDVQTVGQRHGAALSHVCLLYTSDAADE